ncbi:phage tail protein [Flavilitoribacter nigricans]|uniref:Glycerol acyltransferase n=1 Tax=Flavilitoribacter nigricans (strain ATCC 23147 / DSM 23189 / NBRC 102662 / NCIMB 1420 / SS-2) TaxID=1122177 RepID=A0A2D0N0M1_FLAN2|nr:phage tail protein [Flavilitoribacter nigricans]PHN01263.1 glycerol acyltransferase [Flavilitoribacter nigricans DSM 23189 = NBRC 102662]
MPPLPPLGFQFSVRFEGITDSDVDTRFQKVQGLEGRVTLRAYREGGQNRSTYHLPESVEHAPLVLSRGASVDSKVTRWCLNAIEDFEFVPVNIMITLLNNRQQPLLCWYVINAIPQQLKFGELDAGSSQVFIETITLEYEHFKTILEPQRRRQ